MKTSRSKPDRARQIITSELMSSFEAQSFPALLVRLKGLNLIPMTTERLADVSATDLMRALNHARTRKAAK